MTVDLMRHREEGTRTTNVELFFDLVYVFATTQLSHSLLQHHSAVGALEAGLLLAMVWQAWAYTTWVTNWLNPETLPVRAVLLVMMAASLAMSAAIPEAFGERAMMFAVAYAFLQVGRTLFAIWALTDPSLRRNYQRILVWCTASSALTIIGASTHHGARAGCWIVSVVIDVAGASLGFVTPGLGRSSATEWTISGDHFADRCQAFLLIALGEAVVVIGEALSEHHLAGAATVEIFITAFVGCALLWWVYFDRSAEEGAKIIAASDEPGRLGRSAYHMIHPVMVAGIIVTATADQAVIEDPTAHTTPFAAWTVIGGVGLFIFGHALFKMVVWRRVPWTRLLAVALLAVTGTFATHVPAWVLGTAVGVVVLALVISDRALPVIGDAQQTPRPA